MKSIYIIFLFFFISQVYCIQFDENLFNFLKEYEETSNLKTINCTSNAVCNYNGQCSEDRTKCICDKEYATYNSDDGTECNYERKKAWLALVLQLFFGWSGAGYFYLELYNIAVPQLILTGVPFILMTIVCCALCCSRGRVEFCEGGDCGFMCLVVVGVMWFLMFILWYLISVILIGVNHYTDGNGIKPMAI
jgi:hypothetical protein